MKRLLGLLLVMGMVGCGGKENAGNAVDPSIGADEQLVTDSGGEKNAPSNPNVEADDPPVQVVDGSNLVERDGLTYRDRSETPFTGTAVYRQQNGQKHSEGTFKDGKMVGLWTKLHANGQKKSEANWKDGKLEGPATSWYESGQKMQEATLKDGKMVGLWTSWYESGQKKAEENFKDGLAEGLHTEWHENGQKASDATWKDGKKVSETMWDEEGDEIKE